MRHSERKIESQSTWGNLNTLSLLYSRETLIAILPFILCELGIRVKEVKCLN